MKRLYQIPTYLSADELKKLDSKVEKSGAGSRANFIRQIIKEVK